MGRTGAEAYEVGRAAGLTKRLQLVRIGIRLERLFVFLGLVARGAVRHVAAIAAAVAGLELLEELVALGLVDRQVVVDEHPVGALELLEVEDLGVQRGGVVDDDHHLGLGVEVGPRPDDELVELVFAPFSHWAEFYRKSRMVKRQVPSSRSCRSISCSTSSGGLPWRSRRSLRATTSWRTSSRSAGSALD